MTAQFIAVVSLTNRGQSPSFSKGTVPEFFIKGDSPRVFHSYQAIRGADLKPDLSGAEVKVGLRALRYRYETGCFKAF